MFKLFIHRYKFVGFHLQLVYIKYYYFVWLRLNESADVQQKMGMLGKSASRHLDQLKVNKDNPVQL